MIPGEPAAVEQALLARHAISGYPVAAGVSVCSSIGIVQPRPPQLIGTG
jgi:hypothetical protein